MNLLGITELVLSTTFPSLERAARLYIPSNSEQLTRLDVRGAAIDELALYERAMLNLTFVGDETFPGTLFFSYANWNHATVPFTVEGIKTLGGLRVYGTYYLETIDLPWLERVTGTLDLYDCGVLETITMPRLRSVGTLRLRYFDVLDMPALEEITAGGFNLVVAAYIPAISLPALRSVTGDLAFTGIAAGHALTTLDFPALASITGTLAITGMNNATFTDLSGFSALTAAAGVTISNFTRLNDFEPLKRVITAFPAAAWKVAGCAYNPTYQQMQDGHYTN
jgi:hypothetical protein